MYYSYCRSNINAGTQQTGLNIEQMGDGFSKVGNDIRITGGMPLRQGSEHPALMKQTGSFPLCITRCLPAAQRFALLALLEKKFTRACKLQAQIKRRATTIHAQARAGTDCTATVAPLSRRLVILSRRAKSNR
ncbi:hypothetical protein J6590_090495, partial [Homalodisca vitripennis]